MPEYLRNHPVYYAGPAKTPAGMPSGSFGPTTAGRMDSLRRSVRRPAGGSLIMLAQRAIAAPRSRLPARSTAASVSWLGRRAGGSPARRIASSMSEVLEFPELGMEAVWRIQVVDFPAFIIVDDEGNDFFSALGSGHLPLAP